MRKPDYELVMTAPAARLVSGLGMDDLQEKHREIAEVVGFGNLMRLVEHFGGNSIYIPQRYELYRNKMYAEILDRYDGTNIKRLATEYGISEKTVYTIVKDRLLKGSARKQLEGQLSFADIGLE